MRVHSGAEAAAAARSERAQAFTVGNNVVFGAGRHAPGTSEGRWLLAHELAHVIQQHNPPSPDHEAEAEAREAATRVSRGQYTRITRGVVRGSLHRYGETENVPGTTVDQKPPPPMQLPGSLRVRIVAYASPRWRSAKDAKEADRENLELSRKRLKEVRDVVDVRLQDRLGPNVRIDYDLEYADTNAHGTVLMTGEAHGSQDTLKEAKGNRKANDPYYRRVDVYIDDTASTESYAQSSRPHTTHKVSKSTDRWGVAVRMSSSISLGLAVGIISIRLKNLDTGRYGDITSFPGAAVLPAWASLFLQ